MQQVYDIVGEVGFDRPRDREQFGIGDRIVSINCFINSYGSPVIGVSFDLGAKPDDKISLILPLEELMVKLALAIFEAEH